MKKEQNNQKDYHYVLSFTDDGPVYLTGLKTVKEAEFDKEKKPKCFKDIEEAKDLALWITLQSGEMTVAVSSKIKIDSQPYNYRHYKVTFQMMM